ncbi:tRNA 2-selenouridine synthase, partial [Striga asiatica]
SFTVDREEGSVNRDWRPVYPNFVHADERGRRIDSWEEPIRAGPEENRSARSGEADGERAAEAERGGELGREPDPGPAQARQAHRAAGEAREEECWGTREYESRHGGVRAEGRPVGGRQGDCVLGELATGGGSGERVVGGYAARVVIASGPWPIEAVAARGVPGEGALGRSAANGPIRRGDVVSVAIGPEEAASEVDGEVHWDERRALVDCGEVLEGSGIFSHWEDQSIWSKRGLSAGNGDEQEQR